MVEIEVYSTVGASEDELPKFRDYVLRSRGDAQLKVNSIWMRVSADGGSGLMERSEKPRSDPIFGDGISPA